MAARTRGQGRDNTRQGLTFASTFPLPHFLLLVISWSRCWISRRVRTLVVVSAGGDGGWGWGGNSVIMHSSPHQRAERREEKGGQTVKNATYTQSRKSLWKKVMYTTSKGKRYQERLFLWLLYSHSKDTPTTTALIFLQASLPSVGKLG